MELNNQANELNIIIKEHNPAVHNLLSKKGKAIYFPKEGILAQSAEAKGKKFNATIGDAIEDNGTVMHIKSIAESVNLPPNRIFSYSPSYGNAELREIWKEKTHQKNPSLKAEISLPVTTCALTHALNITGFMFVDTGNRIVTSDKYWENYRLVFENAYSGILETYNTFREGGLDLKSFKKKMQEGSGKKIVLFNFPNNPSGYTVTQSEAKQLLKIIEERANEGDKIIVIIDDAYFGLVYRSNIYQESLFAEFAGLHDNVLAVKVDGPTKEDYAWGLRIGFITYGIKNGDGELYRALEDKTAGAIRATVSNASNLSQSLLLKAYRSETYGHEKKEKYNLLKSRFEKVQEVLKDKKYLTYFFPLPCNSGYFICIELKRGIDAEKVRKILLEKYATGVIVFGNLIRIAFSSIAESKIKQIFENIYEACREVMFKVNS